MSWEPSYSQRIRREGAGPARNPRALGISRHSAPACRAGRAHKINPQPPLHLSPTAQCTVRCAVQRTVRCATSFRARSHSTVLCAVQCTASFRPPSTLLCCARCCVWCNVQVFGPRIHSTVLCVVQCTVRCTASFRARAHSTVYGAVYGAVHGSFWIHSTVLCTAGSGYTLLCFVQCNV